MKRTTSIHNLNADRGLSKFQKIVYLFLNWINNLFPYVHIDKKLEIKYFNSISIASLWKRSPITSSPSRKLSDLFWMNLPWSKIEKELGRINVMDIGCGSGEYGTKLTQWSKNRIDHYTGIDLHKHDNWISLKKKDKKFTFYQSRAEDIDQYIKKGTNLFISQSAIEHFDNDLEFFKQIQAYCTGNKKNMIQIHLMPSAPCLYLYLFHGARQYTPRNISKITKLFSAFSYSIIFPLGGRQCNRLHYKFITASHLKKVREKRISQPEEYDKALWKAIRDDMKKPTRSCSFYALVIHSFYRNKIFQAMSLKKIIS